MKNATMNTTPDMPIPARVTILEDTVSQQAADIEALKTQLANIYTEVLALRNKTRQETNLMEE